MPGRKIDPCFRYYGTSFEAKQWFSLDPCGMMGLAISYGINIYALITLYLFGISGQRISIGLFYCVYVPISFLAILSLFRASTTDPGAVPLGAKPLSSSTTTTATAIETSRSIQRCHKCEDNFKPARAHHDSVTGRCIVKFDHFCPWVGNAIGALNHKFFCLFVFYTAMSCLVSILLLFLRYFHCGYHKHNNYNNSQSAPPECQRFLGNKGDDDGNSQYNNMSVTVLGIVSLVFLAFTTAMSCEQLEAIQTGKGKIARMKTARSTMTTIGGGRNREQQQQTDEYERVTDEFNEMFGGNSPHVAWHWWLPTTVQFPQGMKPIVLGFDFDPDTSNTVYRQSEEEDDDDDDEVEGENQQLLRANENRLDEEMGIKQQPVQIFSREASSVSIDSLQSSGKNTVKNRRSGGRESVSPFDDKTGGDGLQGISLVERTSSSVTSSPKTRMT